MFVIRKRSRFSPGKQYPYSGPSCFTAGVVPQIYADRASAERDAEKLTSCNPVGFDVVEIDKDGIEVESRNLG
jgi:hypothetical protein